jgi:hypothetical protein
MMIGVNGHAESGRGLARVEGRSGIGIVATLLYLWAAS